MAPGLDPSCNVLDRCGSVAGMPRWRAVLRGGLGGDWVVYRASIDAPVAGCGGPGIMAVCEVMGLFSGYVCRSRDSGTELSVIRSLPGFSSGCRWVAIKAK